MATRLYLPSSGTPPLASLAVNANWELTNGLVRLPCFTAKQNTALATTQMTWPATLTQQWCWWQFQSEILKYGYSWTTAEVIKMVIGKCAETTTQGDTHLAYVIRIVSGDGSVIRGVIGLYHATVSEFPAMASACTRIHNRTNGATAFDSEPGDRIIVEIGLHGVTPAMQLIQMRIGDPSATGDFTLTAGLTTDLCPWIELAQTVEFGTPPEEHSGSAVISGNGSLAGVPQKGARGSAVKSGGGALLALGLAGMLGLAGISGGGLITAAGEKGIEQHSGAGAISGNGALSGSGSKAGADVAAISDGGSAVAGGEKSAQDEAGISGMGQIGTDGYKEGKGSVSVSGAGAAQGTGIKAALEGAGIFGGGSLTASGIAEEEESPDKFGRAALSGGGSLDAIATRQASGAASISGIMHMIAQGIADYVKTRIGMKDGTSAGMAKRVAPAATLRRAKDGLRH